MNRQIPCCNQFIPMHHYSEQILCMDTKNSSLFNQPLPIGTHHSYISHHHHPQEFDKIPITRSKPTAISNINRYLSMPSVDQIPQEEHPLRIHVGNIPFLWTIDDLCKQFLVFGPIKDPEIVTNERGSKGFGFITFLRHNDGLNAIRVKNGSIADGRKITVALASSRSSTRINSSHCHCCHINNNFCKLNN